MTSQAERFFQAITARPRMVLAVGLLLMALPAPFLPRLRKDTRNDAFMSPDHPAIVSRDRVRAIFGLSDPMVIAVVNEGPEGIFTPHTLALVSWLTDRVAAVPGVDRDRVKSLTTERGMIGTSEGLEVELLVEEPPTDQAGADRIRELVMGQEMYLGRLVARDGSATLVVAELEDQKQAQRVYEDLLTLVADAPVGDATLHVAGEGATNGYVGSYIDADAQRMNPLAGMVMVVVLYLAYRSLRGVLAPSLVVLGALSITLGSMAAAGVPFYLVTSAMTVILIGIGVCDAIHILGQYYEEQVERPDASARELTVRALTAMWQPVFLTSLTSIAGFLCMGLATFMPPLRAFGLFAAAGVAVALLLSLVLVPALLALLPVRASRAFRRSPAGDGARSDVFGRAIGGLGRVVMARPARVIAVATVVIAVATLGARRVRIDDERIRSFQPHEPIVQADRAINGAFDGTNNIDIVIETAAAKGLYQPRQLRRIEALQAYLETLPHVRGTVSIVDYVKHMHRAMNDGRVDAYHIPDTAGLIAQYFLLYDMSGDPEDFEELVDYDFRLANVRVMMDRGRWSDFGAVVGPAEHYIRKHFAGPDVTATISGSGNARYQRSVELRRDHPRGVALAFVVVWALAAVAFRSATGGLIALVPVGIAVLLTYAMMGFAGIWLGLGTSMAAAIAIGLAVDFSVHTLSRLLVLVRDQGLTIHEASMHLYPSTGRALLFNFAAVCLGFGVLVTSRVPALGEFGMLVGTCVTAAFLASVTVLPALLAVTRPAFLFGRRPAHTPSRPAWGAAALAHGEE